MLSKVTKILNPRSAQYASSKNIKMHPKYTPNEDERKDFLLGKSNLNRHHGTLLLMDGGYIGLVRQSLHNQQALLPWI